MGRQLTETGCDHCCQRWMVRACRRVTTSEKKHSIASTLQQTFKLRSGKTVPAHISRWLAPSSAHDMPDLDEPIKVESRRGGLQLACRNPSSTSECRTVGAIARPPRFLEGCSLMELVGKMGICEDRSHLAGHRFSGLQSGGRLAVQRKDVRSAPGLSPPLPARDPVPSILAHASREHLCLWSSLCCANNG